MTFLRTYYLLLLVGFLAFDIVRRPAVFAERPRHAPENSHCVSICTPDIPTVEQSQKIEGFPRSTSCYLDSKNPAICCPLFDRAVINVPTTQSEPTAETSSYGEGLDYQNCGISKAPPNRAIRGGPAPLGAWPWIAALGYKNKSTPKVPRWYCAGTLISAQHVLTAAHCVFRRSDLYLARLGEHDILADYDGAHPIDVPIVLGVIHPKFSPGDQTNDVAVLKLKSPVALTDAVHPICLPKADTRNVNYTNTNHFIAGWNSFNARNYGPRNLVLREAHLPVISQEHCFDTVARNLSILPVIDERILCLGRKNGIDDSCIVDAGGPLMTRTENTGRFTLTAIELFGFKCGESNKQTAAYTRVTEFLDFIHKQLEN